MRAGSAVRWVVRGRVQGVYYRYFTRQAALELGLVGWVRNLPDGSVEVQVAGEDEVLEKFRQRLLVGPPMSQVDDVAGEALPAGAAADWQSFEIRY